MTKLPQLRSVLILLSGPLLFPLLLAGCSMGQLVARGASPILAGGMASMYQETDLELAREAMPAQLKLMEALLHEAPKNRKLLLYTAQGFYGYAFGFVEDENPRRASGFYHRCFRYALTALRGEGLDLDPQRAQQQDVSAAVARLGRPAVPALFWTASCWAKWIDMNRDRPARVAELGRVVVLMRRVLALDERYFYGGADLFFGVYYSSRPPMLGGDYTKAREYFARAEKVSGGSFYLADVLYAQYLARQTLDQKVFEERLRGVLARSPDRYPDIALLNLIAQEKARFLLAHEKEYF